MSKKYTLKCTKTGNEWELDSFVSYVRAWWGIIRKHPHTFSIKD